MDLNFEKKCIRKYFFIAVLNSDDSHEFLIYSLHLDIF